MNFETYGPKSFKKTTSMAIENAKNLVLYVT